ncbi:MAG: glycosyltransferase family 4 protein [Candidatus Omnitrophica bacterium]|nr:glycosyltransferase family 4 protein [Candidatus Omnitrophota bacterium]
MSKYRKIIYGLPRRQYSGIKQTEDILIGRMREAGVEAMEFFYFGSFSDDDSTFFRIFSRSWDLVRFMWRCCVYRPDIVHFNTSFDRKSVTRDVFFAVAARMLFVKFVMKVHGSDKNFLNNMTLPWKTLGWICIFAANKVCIGTYVEREEFLSNSNFKEDKFVVMKNAVDISEFNKLDEDAKYFSSKEKDLPVILYLSRIMKEKGAFDLLEAIPDVLEKRKANFYFGGFGKERNKLAEMIKEKKLERYVHMLPVLSDEEVKRIYHFCDMFVFPTRCAEGIPISLLNALVCGVPIVTTKFRFSMDYLQEPDNCLFVEIGDPNSLADKIVYLIDRSALRSKMSENNKRLALGFDKNIVVRDYLALYGIL